MHNQSKPTTKFSDLIQLKHWNTPNTYNSWEQITKQNPGQEIFNFEETHKFIW